MADRPTLTPARETIDLTCTCGWEGALREITEYAVERDRDRVVRRCPGCETSVPEWGALAPIDGVARVAKGPLYDTLAAAGVIEE